ncbi:MAG: geranylgeranyl reductase family protein [Acidobacteria bacterium]|nr:MAG: geranylgeranyl reductase family protein [Acidobacteriota bacterium]RPJ87283.1 MAG: geranylgeranyl reductase family protein [Acidobacteriota bacterium]
MASLYGTTWDTAIIGAGPAGGALAIDLATFGHKVLLIDKERFPREKVCGDLLGTSALETLKKLGICEKVRRVGYELKRTRIYRRIEVRFLGAVHYPIVLQKEHAARESTFILERRILDSILCEEAATKGAVFTTGKVTEIDAKDSSLAFVRIAGSDTPVRARIAVIATGADILLAEKLGMITRKEATGFAARCYIQSDFTMDEAAFYFDRYRNPSGYAWLFPMGNRMYNAGCGYLRCNQRIDLKKEFHSFLSEFDPAAELLKHGKIASPLRGGSLRTGLAGSNPVGPGAVLAVGETIGTTRPTTGEGIGPAMWSAGIAAQVINEVLRSGDIGLLKTYPERLVRQS